MDVKKLCCGQSAACLAHCPFPVRDGCSTGLILVSSQLPGALAPGLLTVFFPSVEGVISSVGLDGSGYKQYKSGPGLLVSFTHTENVLVWATQQKGQRPDQLRFSLQTAGGDNTQ